MTTCFADTSYYIALLSQRDDAHEAAVRFTNHYNGTIITTSAVLLELGNHLSGLNNRTLFSSFAAELKADPAVKLVHVDQRLFWDAVEFYHARPDKNWSLTDCISFQVMQDLSLNDVLTLDRHFMQAGFRVLLP